MLEGIFAVYPLLSIPIVIVLVALAAWRWIGYGRGHGWLDKNRGYGVSPKLLKEHDGYSEDPDERYLEVEAMKKRTKAVRHSLGIVVAIVLIPISMMGLSMTAIF